jgi:hypothetical protein
VDVKNKRYFPQNKQHFHKNIAAKPNAFRANREYLSIQRKSNLPVGESRQGPSGEPGTGPAREPQRNHSRIGNETREALRKLAAYGWTGKALAANGMTEEYGKRELRSKAPNTSGVTISCDLVPEPGLRKIGKVHGRDLEREIALCFFARDYRRRAKAPQEFGSAFLA